MFTIVHSRKNSTKSYRWATIEDGLTIKDGHSITPIKMGFTVYGKKKSPDFNGKPISDRTLLFINFH